MTDDAALCVVQVRLQLAYDGAVLEAPSQWDWQQVLSDGLGELVTVEEQLVTIYYPVTRDCRLCGEPFDDADAARRHETMFHHHDDSE
jgi:asparagine synthetase A